MANRRRTRKSRGKKFRKNSQQEAEFHAQPYADERGFYFDTAEDFKKGMDTLLKRGIEEVEIQFISGDDEDTSLATSLLRHGVLDQNNIERWYEDIQDELDSAQKAVLQFIVERGEHDLDYALGKLDDFSVFVGEAENAVEELLDERGGPVEALSKEELDSYFDYEKYARDMNFNGALHEITVGGETYTILGTF